MEEAPSIENIRTVSEAAARMEHDTKVTPDNTNNAPEVTGGFYGVRGC
jgi:hypothetical protein